MSRTANVTIDLQGQGDPWDTVDTFLYLWRLNSGGTKTILDLNDDVGDSLDSRITRSLAPARYMIGATTYASGATGDYRLHIRVIQEQACSSYAMPTTSATSSVSTARTSADCVSGRRPGSYADFYNFLVEGTADRWVTIDLTFINSDVDTFLYLVSGNTTAGTGYLERDDDGGDLYYDSRITRRLSPGTYTIEATTYSAYAKGSYRLAISGHR